MIYQQWKAEIYVTQGNDTVLQLKKKKKSEKRG